MKYKYSKNEADSFNKHGIDLTVFLTECASANVVYVETDEGHFQEFQDKESTYIYYVIEGEGLFVINDEKVSVQKGDQIVIPPMHRIHYFGNLKMTLTVTPAFKPENEIHVRYINKSENPLTNYI